MYYMLLKEKIQLINFDLAYVIPRYARQGMPYARHGGVMTATGSIMLALCERFDVFFHLGWPAIHLSVPVA